MAKLTLLDVVNAFMDYTDGWRVSTIDDTTESQQVAGIAEKVYLDLRNDVFETTLTQEIIQLEALADSTKPNYLRLPDSVIHTMESKVMYNITNGASGNSTLKFQEIKYMRPQEFLDLVGQRSTLQTNTEIVTDFSGYQMVIFNKKAPEFYTSFDDEYLIFDAYDSDVDSTLQSSKSAIVASIQGSFTQSDTYEIDFPEWFQSTYQNAVIAEAAEALRGEPLFSIARKARLGVMRARQKMRIGAKGVNTKRRFYGR